MKEVKRIGAVITSTRQRAQQADGSTPLQTLGETRFELERGHHKFVFNGLVVQNLTVNILAGMPFQHYNDVFVRPGRKTIHIGDCCTFYTEGSGRRDGKLNRGGVASVLRVPAQVTLFPGNRLELPMPKSFENESDVAVEPRYDAPSIRSKESQAWLECHIAEVVDGMVAVYNKSKHPVQLKKHEQGCQIRQVGKRTTWRQEYAKRKA